MTMTQSAAGSPMRLAKRMARMPPSAVREILKVAEQPEVLSFAGGLPAPELFPVQEIAEAHARVFARDGAAALQYSTTEGYGPLREWIAARLRRRGMKLDVDQVLITNGSQQGIDLAARVLINPGDPVAVENPSYLAALQSLSGCEAEFLPLGSDDEGLRVDELVASPVTPRLLYAEPEFNNPKGTTLSQERRERLIKWVHECRVPVVEDDPYCELRFRGEPARPLRAMDDSDRVIYLGTFSKTLAPGLRLGWMVGSKPLIRAATIAKQAADLHCASLTQRAVFELLQSFDLDRHIARLRQVYGERCDAMLAALAEHMPEGTRWTRPEGGMFIWLELPQGLSADDLFADALREKVAFVPGSGFFAGPPQTRFMRLNFSNRAPALIGEGMSRLGKVVRSFTLRSAPTPTAPSAAGRSRHRRSAHSCFRT